jgi:hypothetical protein
MRKKRRRKKKLRVKNNLTFLFSISPTEKIRLPTLSSHFSSCSLFLHVLSETKERGKKKKKDKRGSYRVGSRERKRKEKKKAPAEDLSFHSL